jgi:hypothetical protein
MGIQRCSGGCALCDAQSSAVRGGQGRAGLVAAASKAPQRPPSSDPTCQRRERSARPPPYKHPARCWPPSLGRPVLCGPGLFNVSGRARTEDRRARQLRRVPDGVGPGRRAKRGAAAGRWRLRTRATAEAGAQGGLRSGKQAGARHAKRRRLRRWAGSGGARRASGRCGGAGCERRALWGRAEGAGAWVAAGGGRGGGAPQAPQVVVICALGPPAGGRPGAGWPALAGLIPARAVRRAAGR